MIPLMVSGNLVVMSSMNSQFSNLVRNSCTPLVPWDLLAFLLTTQYKPLAVIVGALTVNLRLSLPSFSSTCFFGRCSAILMYSSIVQLQDTLLSHPKHGPTSQGPADPVHSLAAPAGHQQGLGHVHLLVPNAPPELFSNLA